MAAEVVGGAFLSSFLNVVFDRLSKPEVLNWIRGKKLDQKLLGRLKGTLDAAEVLLNDAERRQIKERPVRDWLDGLKDAFYKAGDLLDEVFTKAATQKDPGNFLSRFVNSQDREMVTKIEDIIDAIESIVKQRDILGLKEIPVEKMSGRIESTSVVKMSDMYGRDQDREAIVKLLLDDTNGGEISVIPIVGMGGIGKTTLAQMVFDDNRVKQKFNFKKWVCVGEDFDVIKMSKTVLEAVEETSSMCNTNNFDSIQLKLKDKLMEKKFLVVLDDVWNNNHDAWERFLIPFQFGCEGSKILVTTRDNALAAMVQTKTIQAYTLGLLSDEYCWSLFAKHACLSTESRDYSDLEKVGRKIVKKCKGLPLAAKTLGGLLKTKNKVADWKKILKNQIWEYLEDENNILPALRISYHYLPSYLKRCFVYCSLYPKDYPFDRDELVLLWMAEDLLQPPKSGSTLEETGYKYFDDLASRSFFQPSNIYENLFVMHDLLHDLAVFYGGKFYFTALELGSEAKVDIKTCHLSYHLYGDYSILKIWEARDSLKHARTLLGINFYEWYKLSREIDPCILLSQLKCLRVLSFKLFHDDDDPLPDSVGELIHLRYLDISNTPIVTLPESMSNLYNLQTLKLRNCKRLKMLPSNMQNLVNLRHLDIRGTNLKEMPKGMNKLKDLQFLSDYFVGNHEDSRIRDFGALTSLHGSLDIYNLENVINSFEASEAKMFCKEHINILELKWSSNEGDVNSQTERDILDKLQPYTDLKVLSIQGYRGTNFPNWLGHSSYHNMTDLKLQGCRNCCMLPSLGQLPSLKSLRLQNFDLLETIDAKFYESDEPHGVTPFPSLKTLKFDRMSCWREWQVFGFDAFPQLEKLRIEECPMLTGDLPRLLPTLKKLTIRGCNQLACPLPIAPSILELNIYDKKEVRIEELPLSLMRKLSISISGSQQLMFFFDAMTHTQPTCLRSLYISDCSSAISFPGACLFASLEQLIIKDCKNLEFPMQGQQQHQSLQSLGMHNSCDSPTSFPLSAFPNLVDLSITGCENIKSLEVSQSQDAAPPILFNLRVEECPSFVSLLSQSRNAALPSLWNIWISSCPRFVSFSALALAVPHLEKLTIMRCPEIDSLAEGDEGLPPELRILYVYECDKLVRHLASSAVLHSSSGLTNIHFVGPCESVKCFPREGCLPASLQNLGLDGFSSLETLDCKGLLHLTSLKYLSIEHCTKLENMAGERLPASLTSLSINQCTLLGERIRMKDRQVWPKISHIRKIEVDGRPIS